METPHPGHVPLDLGDLEWGLNFTINFAETGATCDVDTLCWIFARKVRVQLSLQLLTCTVDMGKHIGEGGVLERGCKHNQDHLAPGFCQQLQKT